MSKSTDIFNFIRTCPQCENLWSIAATEKADVKVILPQGASDSVQIDEHIDVNGDYECSIIPYPSVYEDFQINCFEVFDAKDSSTPEGNINVLNYDEVQAICDWIKQQNEVRNLPDIKGEQVISIECKPFVPQIRYVNAQENIIAYFITVRIRYVNRQKRIDVYYECSN